MEYSYIILTVAQIIAVAIIPLIVWKLSVKYQDRKTKQDAKLQLFLTLMANRKKTVLTTEWVDSLNLIDVVFQDDDKVRSAWKDYFESLHPQSIHNADGRLYLLALLSEMAKNLNYKNLKQTEIDHFYTPQGQNSQLTRHDLIQSETLRVLLSSKSYGETFDLEGFQENNKRLFGDK